MAVDQGVRVQGSLVPRGSARSRAPPDGRSRAGHVGTQHVLLLCLVAHNVPADRDAHRDCTASASEWIGEWRATGGGQRAARGERAGGQRGEMRW